SSSSSAQRLPHAGVPTAHGSLQELQRMITKATGRSAVLYYTFYGCYCGWGGRGQPKDATDRCCQRHDVCYDSLLRHGCDGKWQHYRYDWHGDRPACGEERRRVPRSGPMAPLMLHPPVPAAKGSWCAQQSCECDRSLAFCLRQHRDSYRTKLRFYPRFACR
ncbi:PA2GD phospholipase, partial [Crypturellus undulatus]|nr:PA2GD phospholipase [Crypturellus undulatus]